MNGYGTIDRMYRPLAIGTIKRDQTTVADVIFTASAVKGGMDGYHGLVDRRPGREAIEAVEALQS
jgi:hypothetical protein